MFDDEDIRFIRFMVVLTLVAAILILLTWECDDAGAAGRRRCPEDAVQIQVNDVRTRACIPADDLTGEAGRTARTALRSCPVGDGRLIIRFVAPSPPMPGYILYGWSCRR